MGGSGRNSCVCGTALPADLRWVGYSGPCRVCSRPVVIEPPINYTDPLLLNEGNESTVKALVFEPVLRMDWFTRDTGSFYSNDWLVLQSDEKLQIFEVESTLNLLAQRYDKLKSGASESRITRRWEVAKAAKSAAAAEERQRELERLERFADLVLTAVDEAQILERVRPDTEHGRKRLHDRAEQIRRFEERLASFTHLVDLFDPEKSKAVWEGEPRYSGVSRVHDLRALRQIMLGRWQQASEELERSIRCDPEDPVPRQHRLLLGARLGRLEQGESDADWLAERQPQHRGHWTAWRAYFRFCRDRLEEAKSDARQLWPSLEGDELADRMSQLLREHEDRAHTLHERWLVQFNITPGPPAALPPVGEARPFRGSADDVVRQALTEAAEMGGGRVLMGPSRLGERVFMVVVQPADGAAYWLTFAAPQDVPKIAASLRGGDPKSPLVRRQFNFKHRAVDHQIDVCVRRLEAEVEFAELRVTPLRRGVDAYQPPPTMARPVRTAVLGFLQSGVSDTMADKLNSALVRGLTAFNSIPVVRGRTLAYAGVTLNDASEDMAGTLSKIRGEFNAERFIYARLDAMPETPDSGLQYSISLIAGDAWINHAEAIRSYGLYDRENLETAVELAAQEFARSLRDSDLVPDTSTGPEFPPADPKRRAIWLKLMAGHHELKYDRRRAIQYLREGSDLEKGDGKLKTALALLLYIEGELQSSEALLRDVADRFDEAPAATAERARSRLRLARVLTAEQDFVRAQQEILAAGRLSEEVPELASAVQRALRYLGLEALEVEALSASLYALGRALGEAILRRDAPDPKTAEKLEAAFVQHYEGVLRLKVPARLRALLDKLQDDYVGAVNRLWLETDFVLGEDIGVRARTVTRLGRLSVELASAPDEEARAAWTSTGEKWVEWLEGNAPRLYWISEKKSELEIALRAEPQVVFAGQEARPEPWSAPHLELAPVPEVLALEDGRVIRLEEGRYRIGRLDAQFASMLQEVDLSRRATSGYYVVYRGRRGVVDSPVVKFLMERGPLQDAKRFVPPAVRIVFWKSDRREAPPVPELLDKWLFTAGPDEPRLSPPWITLPSGRPRGWRCREARGEFIPEEVMRFGRDPAYYKRADGVYGVFFIPVFGGA